MNWNYKKLSAIFTTLFIVGIAAVAYWFYFLPEEIVATHAIGLKQVSLLEHVFIKYYLLVGSVLGVGLIALVLQILNNRSGNNSNIVYVESFKKEKNAGTGNELDTEDDNILEENLLDVEVLLSSDKDYKELFDTALSEICKKLEASQAAAYQVKKKSNSRYIELFASFAYPIPDEDVVTYKFGEGLAGQVAKEGKIINLDSVPQGYIEILSGLGKSTPSNLIIIPLQTGEAVSGVVEIASFKPFSEKDEITLKSAFDKLALKLTNNDNVSLKAAK